MAGLTNNPFPSKWVINQEDAGQDSYWSTVTTLDDLLFANGQHVKSYADITHIVKDLAYQRLSITESQNLTPLMDFLTGMDAGMETVDKNWVRWRIYGEPERRALSVGDPNPAEVDYLGVGGLEFQLWLDVDWYKSNDVLAPHRNKRIQVVVRNDEPIMYDGGYLYDVVLLSDGDDFIERELLDTSQYWIKMGSVSSWEAIGTPGSIQFGHSFAYMEFEVPLTTMSWEFTVEGEAHRQYGNLEIMRCDEYGNVMPNEGKLSNYLEGQARMQMDWEKEAFLTWGSQAETIMDNTTSKVITTGPSLMQYLECGQVVPYSPEVHGIDFVVEQMDNLWFDRVATANREVVLYTGQAGLRLFSDWVLEKYGDTAAVFDYSFVLSPRQPYDQRGGRQGFAFAPPQFTEYLLPSFGSIKVAHWPILDNTRINGVNYPGTHFPVSSYEFIAFNTGFGRSNVQFLNRTDNKISTYIPGLWSPAGAIGPDNPIWKSGNPEIGDAYKFIHRESFGMAVIDPTTLVWFKPNISY